LTAGREEFERRLGGNLVSSAVDRCQGSTFEAAGGAAGEVGVDGFLFIEREFAVDVEDQEIANFGAGHVVPHETVGHA
jgi:hypothetical protein